MTSILCAMIALLVPVVVLCVVIQSFVRLEVDRPWHKRWRHRCGYHSRFFHADFQQSGICPSCGEKLAAGELTELVARATWPWGWKFRLP